MSLTSIESFCGAGGMSHGLKLAGYDVRATFDNVAAHIETHNNNLGDTGHVLDASEVTGEELLNLAGLSSGELDLFSGGPPCQGFSKQKRGADRFQDPRNSLVLHYARLVRELKPRAFLFENVQIFGQKRGQHLIQEMMDDLGDYAVYGYFVCGTDFGLAQSRGRFLMIGIRHDVSSRVPVLPVAADKKSVRDVIADIAPPPDDYSEHPDFHNHLKCRISKANEERISHVPQGGGWQDIPWDLRLPCHQVTDTKKGGWPDVYGRLTWDGVCPTVTVGFDSFTRGRYGHPEQNRAITPREAARLQGFPDWFRFHGNRMDVRTQIGNAVPPPLAEAAGRAIRAVLNNENETAVGKHPDQELNGRQYALAI